MGDLCTPFETQVMGPANPPPLAVPDAPGTKLITSASERRPYLVSSETDTHRALTRGLAEYLSTLTRNGAGGKTLRFAATLNEWAEPEDKSRYPYAAVYGSDDRGTYEPLQFGPEIVHEFEDSPTERKALQQDSEFTQKLAVDVWATNPADRTALMAMVEEAIRVPDVPVPWMFGTRLWLPHYYGAIAEYEPLGFGYVEDSDSQLRNERKAVLIVQARVSALRLVTRPVFQPQARLTVVSPPELISTTEGRC